MRARRRGLLPAKNCWNTTTALSFGILFSGVFLSKEAMPTAIATGIYPKLFFLCVEDRLTPHLGPRKSLGFAKDGESGLCPNLVAPNLKTRQLSRRFIDKGIARHRARKMVSLS
jgi:hypothetical protein